VFVKVGEEKSTGDSGQPAQLPVQDRQLTTAAGSFPLVGRASEWHVLEETYASIRRDGHFLVLEGEAGIGKTRLAEEFLAVLRSRGAVTLSAHCYQGETNLAYGPLVEGLRSGLEHPARVDWWRGIPVHWISEAARLLPELSQLPVDLPPIPSLESTGAPTRFFEGLSQVLLAICGDHPAGVLFLDDLHWADEASLDLITFLVRRQRNRPFLMLATWRGEEVPPDHRLRQLLAETRRAGNATLLPLGLFTPESVRKLIRSALSSTPIPAEYSTEEDLSDRLYRETEGLPFFIVEYLKELSKAPLDSPVRSWAMPLSVRDLLHSRLSVIGEAEQQVLQTGIHQPFLRF
jgi:predicted ATPase